MRAIATATFFLLAACGRPPQATEKIAVVELKIAPNGDVFWNGQPVNDQELVSHLHEAAKDPKPEIQLQPDRTTEYKYTAKVLRIAQSIGGLHLGFVGVDQ